MARKKNSDTTTENVTPDEVQKMPSARVLKALLKSGAIAKEQMDEIRGTFGQEVKNATENQNLHKGAFAVLRKLDKMEPERAADFVDHLAFYLDASGIQAKIDAVQKLNLAPGEEGTTNVAKFPRQSGEEASA